MAIFLRVAAVLAFGAGMLGIMSMRSDIQLGIGVTGLSAAVILLGIAAVLDRLKALRSGLHQFAKNLGHED